MSNLTIFSDMIYIKKPELLEIIVNNCPEKIEHSITQISFIEDQAKPLGWIRFEDSKTGWEKSVRGNGWIEVLSSETVLNVWFSSKYHIETAL